MILSVSTKNNHQRIKNILIPKMWTVCQFFVVLSCTGLGNFCHMFMFSFFIFNVFFLLHSKTSIASPLYPILIPFFLFASLPLLLLSQKWLNTICCSKYKRGVKQRIKQNPECHNKNCPKKKRKPSESVCSAAGLDE